MKMKILIAATILLVSTFIISPNYTFAKPPVNSKAVKAKIAFTLSELQKNVEYQFSKASVRDLYYSRLDQLADLLKDKKIAVALRGHADNVGKFKPNWVLSQQRADAIKDYLVKKGVPDNLIVSTAFGSTKPIASNKTALGRQKNRRVEIRLDDTGA